VQTGIWRLKETHGKQRQRESLTSSPSHSSHFFSITFFLSQHGVPDEEIREVQSKRCAVGVLFGHNEAYLIMHTQAKPYLRGGGKVSQPASQSVSPSVSQSVTQSEKHSRTQTHPHLDVVSLAEVAHGDQHEVQIVNSGRLDHPVNPRRKELHTRVQDMSSVKTGLFSCCVKQTWSACFFPSTCGCKALLMAALRTGVRGSGRDATVSSWLNMSDSVPPEQRDRETERERETERDRERERETMRNLERTLLRKKAAEHTFPLAGRFVPFGFPAGSWM
jgi:hypothetical protein